MTNTARAKAQELPVQVVTRRDIVSSARPNVDVAFFDRECLVMAEV